MKIARIIEIAHIMKIAHIMNYAHFLCTLTQCPKLFSTNAAVKRHQQSVHPLVMLQCPYCQKWLKTNSQLKRHIDDQHESTEKFSCDFCDATFRCKWNLTQHVRRHEKAKSSFCDQCSYACYSKSELGLHMRVHTGERPFSCGECEVKFKDMAALRKHEKAKHSLGVKSPARISNDE